MPLPSTQQTHSHDTPRRHAWLQNLFQNNHHSTMNCFFASFHNQHGIGRPVEYWP